MIMEEVQLTRMSRYSIKGIYQQLVCTYARVHWYKFVWCRLVTLKHRFFLLLVMHNRMQTAGRLLGLGICDHPRCLICDSEDETQEHLFFRCCYSASVLHKIKCWLGWSNTSSTVPRLLDDIARSRYSRFRKQVYATSVAAMVYQIW